ncbi:hypothetical protein CNY89_30315, partial [Amaricoccus sp. HAR-UPW-R2A-40]
LADAAARQRPADQDPWVSLAVGTDRMALGIDVGHAHQLADAAARQRPADQDPWVSLAVGTDRMALGIDV